jgi:hypothetical protein
MDRSKLIRISEPDIYQDETRKIFILSEGEDPDPPELHLGEMTTFPRSQSWSTIRGEVVLDEMAGGPEHR